MKRQATLADFDRTNRERISPPLSDSDIAAVARKYSGEKIAADFSDPRCLEIFEAVARDFERRCKDDGVSR